MDTDVESSGNYTNLLMEDVSATLLNLGVMAAKIAHNNFGWRYLTLVVFNAIELVALNSFLLNYKKPVTIQFGYNNVTKIPKYVHQCVIFGLSSAVILDTLQWIHKYEYDLKGKYIIICASTNTSECNKERVFKTLLTLNMPNVIFLKTTDRDSNDNEPAAYSFQIITPNKCNNHVPERLELRLYCENDSCFINLYPERFGNFYRCPLVVSAVEQAPYIFYRKNEKNLTGFDGNILKIVADILNATLIIKTPDKPEWGRFINNNWTGSFGDLFNGRVDASLCTAPVTYYTNRNFQPSYTYNYEDIVWAARLPALKPSWENLLYPFSTELTIMLLFIFVGIILVNIILRTNNWQKCRINRSLLFYSWLLFFGLPLQKLPSKQTLLIIIYIWIWFSFVIRNAYQAALFNSLHLRTYQDSLKTLNDVLNYPYGGELAMREYYRSEPEVFHNWIFIDLLDTNRVLDDILDGTTNLVIAAKEEFIKYYVMNYNGTKSLQIVPQKIVSSPSVIYFRKFSPLSTPINRILVALSEAGFIEYEYDKYFNTLNHKFKFDRITDYPEILAVGHLAGSFYILVAGWIISLIYFSVEVLCEMLPFNRHSYII